MSTKTKTDNKQFSEILRKEKLANSRIAYNKFCDLYKQSKYELALDAFMQIDVEVFAQHIAPTEFLLKAVTRSAYNIKPSQSKYMPAIVKGFEYFFAELANRGDFEKIMSLLLSFTHSNNYGKYISVVFEQKKFDLGSWLRKITTSLIKACDNDGITRITPDTAKKMYLDMTGVFLFYVKAELSVANKAANNKFKESTFFLMECAKVQCLATDVKSGYVKSFELMEEFIQSFSQIDKKMLDQINECLTKLETKTAQLRATVFQDIYLTFATVFIVCRSLMLDHLGFAEKMEFLKILSRLSRSLSTMTSDKDFCGHQCKSVVAHTLYDVMDLAKTIFLSLIDLNPKTDAVQSFSGVLILCSKRLSSMSCPDTKMFQSNIAVHINQMYNAGKTKKTAVVLLQLFTHLLRNFDKSNFEKMSSPLTRITLVRYAHDMARVAEDWIPMSKLSYLLVALNLTEDGGDSKKCEIIRCIAKVQMDRKGTIELETPYEYFNRIGNCAPEYNIHLSDKFNSLDVSLEFLRHSFIGGVQETEFAKKIVHQMLMPSKKFEPKKHLRFIFFVKVIPSDQITVKRIDEHLASLKATNKDGKDSQTNVIQAAFHLFKHHQSINEWNKEHTNLSISKELSDEQINSKLSIFRRLTLKHEQRVIHQLRFIKKAFMDFIDFFSAQSEDDRTKFVEEKDFLVESIPKLAGEFLVRDYESDSRDLYIYLYILTNITKDDFGLLDAISYFAEYGCEYKHKSICGHSLKSDEKYKCEFEHESTCGHSLESIVEGCQSMVIEKLKAIDTLSTRKRDRLFCFLLNLALFYMEHERRANADEIMVHIFQSITDIKKDAMESIGKIVYTPGAREPKYSSYIVRIKFYFVLFRMITKYGRPSIYPPLNFIRYSLVEVWKCLDMVSDPRYGIPILVYKMINEMVLWCQYRYETSSTMEILSKFLIKFAYQNGFVRRGADALFSMLLVNLYAEQIEDCQRKFKVFEIMTQINIDIDTESSGSNEAVAVSQATNSAKTLNVEKCEIVCLSPKKVISRGNFSSKLDFFIQDHSSKCKCSICLSSNHKYFLFEVGCAYARCIFIDSSIDVETKENVFKKLYEYWQINYRDERKFPRSNRLYINLARMLMWCAHFEWKYKKNYVLAKEHLSKALKGLKKLNHCDFAFKRDIDAQIASLEEETKRKAPLWAGVRIMNADRNLFQIKPTVVGSAIKIKPPPAIKMPTLMPRTNLLDMINDGPSEGVKFQIHDDDGAAASTPSVKKSTRAKKAFETPTQTKSTKKKAIVPETVPKMSTRSRGGSSKPNLPSLSQNLDVKFIKTEDDSDEMEIVIKTETKRSTRNKK